MHETTTKSLRAPEFLQSFEKVIDDIDPARRFVRAKVHQETAIEYLEEFLEYAENVKQELVIDGYLKDANLILAIGCMVEAVIQELRMIIALKETRPNDAWNHMISAHNSAESAGRTHLAADKIGFNTFLQRLEVYEKLLFPEMLFVSPAFSVGNMTCSICEDEYADCPHIKGRAYAGEFCSVRMEDVHDVDHLAFVDDPYSKAHRVTGTPSGKDMMTLLPPEECNPDDSVVASITSDEEDLPDIDSEIDENDIPEIDSDLDSIE